MKDQAKKQPQVNPPKMSSPDLSKAEMEVKDLIEKSEKGEQMSSNQSSDPETEQNDSFHMNKKRDED